MAKLHIANELLRVVADYIFPVGSIYLSVTTTSPASKFGGTWTQVAKDAYLIGYDSSNGWFNQPGANKGKTSGPGHWDTDGHKLTHDELPVLQHYQGDPYSYNYGDIGNWMIPNGNWYGLHNIKEGRGYAHSHFHVSPYYIVCVWRRTA